MPLLSDIRAGVTEAASASLAIDAIDGVDWDRGQQIGLVEDEIAAQSARLQGYHRDRLIQTFRTALAVDIRGVLSEPEIENMMAVWREENVRLIRTIPPRLHDGLLETASARRLRNGPLTGRRYRKVLAVQEFQSSGYNLRRLTRDQTQKQIANLNASEASANGITWNTAGQRPRMKG